MSTLIGKPAASPVAPGAARKRGSRPGLGRGRGAGRGPGQAQAPGAGTARSALGGLIAAASSLAVLVSLALTGWFLADAGGHGDTTDALRVGADGWLMGHGSRLELNGSPLGIAPLGVTLVLLLAAFRAGRWSARGGAGPADARGWAVAVGLFGCSYVVALVVVAVLASEPGAGVELGRAIAGALAIAIAGGGAGIASGTGLAARWRDQSPVWAREIALGAVTGALGLIAAAAGLVAVSLALSFDDAATVLSALDLSAGDALAYTVVAIALAPNAILFGAAYLLGPGFAVGAGTTVSPTAVSLGAVPAMPLLAALPEEGPTPGWLALVCAVPALAAGIGAAQARRAAAPVPYDIAGIRGAASGFGAGVLVTVAIALAGGPMGTGRMAEVGAPVAEVLVFATGLMAAGGLVGGLACTAAQRWRRARSGGANAAGADSAGAGPAGLAPPAGDA